MLADFIARDGSCTSTKQTANNTSSDSSQKCSDHWNKRAECGPCRNARSGAGVARNGTRPRADRGPGLLGGVFQVNMISGITTGTTR